MTDVQTLLTKNQVRVRNGSAHVMTTSGGASFAYGEVGYIHTDGTVRKSQADGSAAEAECLVMCVNASSISSGGTGLFQFPGGLVTGLTGGTAGSLAFVSATAGAITTTAPVVVGYYVKCVGRWISTTMFWFSPDPEIAPAPL
jgi:hypothetical protein